jgi:hypothetical protein
MSDAQSRLSAAETRLSSAETRLSSAESRLTTAESSLFAATSRLSVVEALANALKTENLNQAAQITGLQAETVPAGTVITYAAEALPAGYLECDGSVVLRADYPKLFGAIGTAWGAGDGASTFNLPDMRGLFLRGWSHAFSSLDPDRNTRIARATGGASGDHVGSFQFDAFANHSHTVNSAALNVFGGFAPVAGGNASGFAQGTTGGAFGGGNETRPRNVYVMYAIKY